MVIVSYLTSLEKNFVLGDIKVFREFDITGFVRNATNGLGTKLDVFSINVNLDHYDKMVSKATDILENTYLSNVQMTSINSAVIDNIPGFQSSKLLDITVSEIRPQYLVQFAKNIGYIIDRYLKGTAGKNEFKHFITDDMLIRVKKQMVRTTMPYYMDAKSLSMEIEDEVIPIDAAYIKSAVIPFVNSFSSRKNETLNQAKMVSNAIGEVSSIMEEYTTAVNAVKTTYRLDDGGIAKLNYLLYNGNRAIISAVSYLAFMMVHKTNLITTNIYNCKKIMDVIEQVNYVDPTLEGVFDTVKSMSEEDIGEDLLSGRIDIYEEISSNILSMNVSQLLQDSNIDPDTASPDIVGSVDHDVSVHNFNTYPYEGINDMYNKILHGIEVLKANSEDYLLVVDDMVEKSGFALSLEKQYDRVISAIDDITIYSSMIDNAKPGLSQTEMYLRVLHEIKKYPENMRGIAKRAEATISAAEALRDSFEENVNNQYENGASIVELKAFIRNFIEDIVGITNLVATKFLDRLQNLGKLLNEYSAKDPVVENAMEDFSIYDELIESASDMTDALFEMLTERYQILKVEKDTGIKLVLEEGETGNTSTGSNSDGPGSQTQSTVQPAQSSTTTTQTTTTNNNTSNGNGNTKVKGAVNKLNKWFQMVIDKIQKLTDGAKAKRDEQYFKTNKEKLLLRNYSNVSNKKPILEYEHHMPSKSIIADLTATANRVTGGALTAQKIQSLSDETAYARVILPSALVKVASDQNPAKAITEYYLHGANTVNPVILKNNQLRSMVQEAVNYCEPYYSTYLPNIRTKVQNIKNNMDTVLSGLTTESVDFIYGMIFTEEEAATTNTTSGTDSTQGNANTTAINTITSMASKCEAIQKWVKIYCNAIITACNMRYSAYMGLLHEIIADTTPEEGQTPTPEQQPQTPPEGQQNQPTQ